MSAIRKTASVVYSTAARKSQITLLEADVKKLTCRDLGGPCDAEITGNSFEEVGKKSHDHVVDQISRDDESHRAAAEKMRNATPEERKAMMAELEKKYKEAPEV